MSTQHLNWTGTDVRSGQGILKAALHTLTNPKAGALRRPVRAFVTVSRQPGAGGIHFSHRLAERLNFEGEGDWSAWEQELVDKVSAEHGIAKSLVEMIETRQHWFLDDLLLSMSASEAGLRADDLTAYKRVAATIHTLAVAGHVIVVGRGGRFVTDHLPGGVHLRLVAPLEKRIESMAQREHLTVQQAAEKIAQLDHSRATFYRRYWPGKSITPETFTLTLNAGEMSVDEMVESVLPIIRAREAGTVREAACAVQH
jgi:CMP/dCMP kinase